MWYHLQPRPGAARIDNAAWCYPEPTVGRENLRDHVTFATGKGIAISEPKTRPTLPLPAKPRPQLSTQQLGGGGGGISSGTDRGSHDSQELRSLRAPASGLSSTPAEMPLPSIQST
eukprot:COSAG02_NODE_394_length_23152_cov_13.232204_17_plen_116_part_00